MDDPEDRIALVPRWSKCEYVGVKAGTIDPPQLAYKIHETQRKSRHSAVRECLLCGLHLRKSADQPKFGTTHLETLSISCSVKDHKSWHYDGLIPEHTPLKAGTDKDREYRFFGRAGGDAVDSMSHANLKNETLIAGDKYLYGLGKDG